MNKMATAFKGVATQADKLDESATSILVVAQQENALTIEDFDQLVSKAYQELNYSQQVGRPAEGSTLQAAPKTLKFYVSRIRLMYNLGLDVMSFKTMQEMRNAVAKKSAENRKAAAAAKPVDELAALRGVKIAHQEEMIGAEVHDIGLVLKRLDDEGRQELMLKLQRLIKQFSKRTDLEFAAAA